jgi:hypothetical protein
MYRAPCLILFLRAWSKAIFHGLLLNAVFVSPSKDLVSTFIFLDCFKHPTFHHHTAFKSYPQTFESELSLDDDDFGIGMESQEQQRKGRKEISPYYKQDRREWDARGSPIFPPISDPIDLANLLQKRHMASLADNSSAGSNEMYEEVACIDQQLRDRYDVVVYSHPPIWSRFDYNAPPDAIRKQLIQKELHTLQRAFGPTGHPYQHVGATDNYCSYLDCDLSMTDIHNLLSQYTKYKCTFQPELADATLFELKLHGVRTSDRTFQWTTDPFFDIDSLPERTSAMEKNDDLNAASTTDLFNRIRRNRNQTAMERQPYSQDPVVLDGIDDSAGENSAIFTSHQRMQQVEQLIRDRFMALQREEHNLVTWITYELYCTFNVTVIDTTKQWSFNNGNLDPTIATPCSPLVSPNPKSVPVPSLIFGNDGHLYESVLRYRESLLSRPPTDLPEPHRSRIVMLVQERIQKREEGKFQEADTIRTILWHTYVSYLDDLIFLLF